MLFRSSAVIVNNSINKAGQHGVAIVEKSSANISDNMIDGSGANGMLISASTGEILNNKISNSGSTGISIQNKSSLSRVSQNELMNNTGKAIAINNSTIKASTGNCMISRESEFEITSVSSDTTLETIRTLTVLNVTPNSTTVSGTCNLTGPVYAVIDGVTYTGIISKREYSISIPNQEIGRAHV